MLFVEYLSGIRADTGFRKEATVAEVILEMNGVSTKGSLALPQCNYTFLCRQVYA